MDFMHMSAIILGGTSGMGKEICLQLMTRGVKNLAVIDMPDQMGAMDVLGPEFKNINFIYKQCSVTDEPKLRTYMTQIKDEFKRLDIIINSSAVLDEMNSKRTIDINYGGVVHSTLIGIELMRRDKGMAGGVIVNIASITALGAHFWLPVYAGSKHAVLGFTRSLKNDKFFELTGIKFIAICPGRTNSPLTVVDAIYRKYIFPEMVDEVKEIVQTFSRQEVDTVGKCIIDAIEDGENGSTWQCENGRIEKLKIIDYPRF